MRMIFSRIAKRFMPLKSGVEIPQKPIVFDGAHSRNWWASRDEMGISSLEAFWEHRSHPRCTAVGKALASLEASSLLEVGCHVGPNLWAATKQHRYDRLAGTDISPSVLRFAGENLAADIAQPVELYNAGSEQLPFDDSSFDIVLSSVMLVCVGPELIEKSISELVRVSAKWLVLCEPYDEDPDHATPEGLIDPYPNTTYWIRNYPKMLEARAELVSFTRLPPEESAGHMNSIAILKKRQW